MPTCNHRPFIDQRKSANGQSSSFSLGRRIGAAGYADWGQIASNLLRITLQDTNKKILETLEVNNEVLDNIHEEFKTCVQERDEDLFFPRGTGDNWYERATREGTFSHNATHLPTIS